MTITLLFLTFLVLLATLMVTGGISVLTNSLAAGHNVQGAQKQRQVGGFFEVSHTGGGVNDLYTCPAGKRAWIPLNAFIHQPNGGTLYSRGKIGGTYYRIGDTQTSNGTPGLKAVGGIVLEAGEVFSVTVGTASGMIHLPIVEFRAQGSALRSYKRTSFTQVGDSTETNGLFTILDVPKREVAVCFHESADTAGLKYFNDDSWTEPLVEHIMLDINNAAQLDIEVCEATSTAGSRADFACGITFRVTAGRKLVLERPYNGANPAFAAGKHIAWVNVLQSRA